MATTLIDADKIISDPSLAEEVIHNKYIDIKFFMILYISWFNMIIMKFIIIIYFINTKLIFIQTIILYFNTIILLIYNTYE